MYLWFLKQNFVLLFHSHSFNFKGYATWYKFDGNANGGGILLYIIEDIPSTSLISVIIKRFFVGTKSKEKRWFLCSSYNPPPPPQQKKKKKIVLEGVAARTNWKLLFFCAISMVNQMMPLWRMSVKSTVAKILSKIRPISKIQ